MLPLLDETMHMAVIGDLAPNRNSVRPHLFLEDDRTTISHAIESRPLSGGSGLRGQKNYSVPVRLRRKSISIICRHRIYYKLSAFPSKLLDEFPQLKTSPGSLAPIQFQRSSMLRPMNGTESSMGLSRPGKN